MILGPIIHIDFLLNSKLSESVSSVKQCHQHRALGKGSLSLRRKLPEMGCNIARYDPGVARNRRRTNNHSITIE